MMTTRASSSGGMRQPLRGEPPIWWPASSPTKATAELGLPRLPQHECTCGNCAPFSETGCAGYLIDLHDRLAARRQRIERATGATRYGR